MFAVNGNRPGPYPRGQSYFDVLAGAKREELEQELEGTRIVDCGFSLMFTGGDYLTPKGTFDTSKGVLGLSFIA